MSIAVAYAVACSMAGPSTGAASERVPSDSIENFTMRVGGGWRTYVSYFGERWEPYPFAGMALDLPTVSPRYFFRTSLDVGRASARTPWTTTLLTLHESFAGITELFVIGPARIRAGLGVSSATFFFTSEFEISEKIFNTSESEFGLFSSLETVYRYKKIEVIVPFSFDYILSLPHPLLMVSIGLQAGGTF